MSQTLVESSSSAPLSTDAIRSTRGMPIPAGSLVGRGYLSQDPQKRIEEIIKVHNQAVKRSREQQQIVQPQIPVTKKDQQSTSSVDVASAVSTQTSPLSQPSTETEMNSNGAQSNRLHSESSVAFNTPSIENNIPSSASATSGHADSDTFERLQQRQAMDWWQVRDAGSDLYASMQRRVSRMRLGEGDVHPSTLKKVDGKRPQQQLSAHESLHHAQMVSAAQTLLVEQQSQGEEDKEMEMKEVSSSQRKEQQQQQRWVEEVLRRAHNPQTFLQHNVNDGLRTDSSASRIGR